MRQQNDPERQKAKLLARELDWSARHVSDLQRRATNAFGLSGHSRDAVTKCEDAAKLLAEASGLMRLFMGPK